MKNSGVIRKTDKLGRIVIPKEVRDRNRWDAYTPFEMWVDDDKIILKKYENEEEKTKSTLEVLEALEEEVKGIQTKNMIRRVASLVKEYEQT